MYTFAVEPAIDRTGFTPSFVDSHIDVATAMTLALNDALRTAGLSASGANSSLRLRTTISEYVPGNAALRQVLPGIGGPTLLKTSTDVLDPAGRVLAKIEVERSIRAGGPFTIGAWREVFDEVSQEIIVQLRSRMLDSRQAAAPEEKI